MKSFADRRAGAELPRLSESLLIRGITQNGGSFRSRVVVSGPGLVGQYLARGPVGIGTHQRNHGGILSGLIGRRNSWYHRADTRVATAERHRPARSRRGGHDDGSE